MQKRRVAGVGSGLQRTIDRVEKGKSNDGSAGRRTTGLGSRTEDPDEAFAAILDAAYHRGSLPRGWHKHASDEGAQGDQELVGKPRVSPNTPAEQIQRREFGERQPDVYVRRRIRERRRSEGRPEGAQRAAQ